MNAHPRNFVMVQRLALRERAERTIEALIAMLDDLDGDADIEDGADAEPDADSEPSLGWEGGNPAQYAGASSFWDCDCEEDQADKGIADFDGLAEQLGGYLNCGGWIE